MEVVDLFFGSCMDGWFRESSRRWSAEEAADMLAV